MKCNYPDTLREKVGVYRDGDLRRPYRRVWHVDNRTLGHERVGSEVRGLWLWDGGLRNGGYMWMTAEERGERGLELVRGFISSMG